MLITIIVAMAKNRCIGREGRLPWQLPGDLQRFKQLTMDHSLLMGRKTFESIGHALAGRTSYVVSRVAGFDAPNCRVFLSLDAAIDAAETAGESELFICGGEEIYRQMLPKCGRIYLTELEREVTGDCFFPPISANFQRVRKLQVSDAESCFFSILERRH